MSGQLMGRGVCRAKYWLKKIKPFGWVGSAIKSSYVTKAGASNGMMSGKKK